MGDWCHDDCRPPPAAAGPRRGPLLRARRRVPGRPARGLRPGPGGARPRGQGATRRAGVRAGPPLPARRGDRVRRRDRRLLQAGSRRGRAAGRRVHRLLRRALHGRVGRHPHLARAEGRPARPGRRLLDGRHGPARPGRGRLGRAHRRGHRRQRRTDHLHELLGRHQGVLRAARRRRLHLVERAGGPGLGLPAEGPGHQGPVPARPAPGPQHRRAGDGPLARGLRGLEPAAARRRAAAGAAARAPR